MKHIPAGIDYSNGQSNIDHATGIRFGVISQHPVSPDALDDIMRDGEDVAWTEALADAIQSAKDNALDEANGDPSAVEEVDEDQIRDDLASGWESNFSNYVYEKDGYKVTSCLDNDLFILASPFFTYAKFCSPCVPGAGNLDDAALTDTFALTNAIAYNWPRVFALGHDWFEGGKAHYPLFNVSDGKEVTT
jgi:hypothetical protein